MRLISSSLALIIGSLIGYLGIAHVEAATPTIDDVATATVEICSHTLDSEGHFAMVQCGSGTIVSSDGLIATNAHVILDASTGELLRFFLVCRTTKVSEPPICLTEANVLAADPTKDIALLRMRTTDLTGAAVRVEKYVDLGARASVQLGATITALGYPVTGGTTITLTRGNVSGFETGNSVSLIKTDASIDHGNSGGGAYDTEMHYIGMPTMVASGLSSLGYLITADDVATFVDAYRTTATPASHAGDDTYYTQQVGFMTGAQTSVDLEQFRITADAAWRPTSMDTHDVTLEHRTSDATLSLSSWTSPRRIQLDRLTPAIARQITTRVGSAATYSPTILGDISTSEVTYEEDGKQHVRYFMAYRHFLLDIDITGSASAKDLDALLASYIPHITILDRGEAAQVNEVRQYSPSFSFVVPPLLTYLDGGYGTARLVYADATAVDVTPRIEFSSFDGTFDELLEQTKKARDEVTASDVKQTITVESRTNTHDQLYIFVTQTDTEVGTIDTRAAFIIDEAIVTFSITAPRDGAPAIRDTFMKLIDSVQPKVLTLPELESASDGPWYTPYVRFLQTIGAMRKSPTIAAVRPEQYVTRAEAVKILKESFNLFESSTAPLADVPTDAWYRPYAETMIAYGITTRTSDNTFAGMTQLTRSEALALIIRASSLPYDDAVTATSFRDVPPRRWYAPYVAYAVNAGIIQPSKAFAPERLVTRAEFAKMTALAVMKWAGTDFSALRAYPGEIVAQ